MLHIVMDEECESEPAHSTVHPSENGHVSQYVVGLKPRSEQAASQAANVRGADLASCPYGG